MDSTILHRGQYLSYTTHRNNNLHNLDRVHYGSPSAIHFTRLHCIIRVASLTVPSRILWTNAQFPNATHLNLHLFRGLVSLPAIHSFICLYSFVFHLFICRPSLSLSLSRRSPVRPYLSVLSSLLPPADYISRSVASDKLTCVYRSVLLSFIFPVAWRSS